MKGELVLIGDYPTEGEADVVVALLETNGIEAMARRDSGTAYPAGGVSVYVCADDEARASELLLAGEMEEATEIGEDADQWVEEGER